MTEEQFEVLRKLLEKILEKLETLDTLAGVVNSRTGRMMVQTISDFTWP